MNLEFSDPGDDAACPVCGCLIWKSTEILEIVIDLCAEQLGIDTASITADSRFVDDLGADSLNLVELVMELEEEFETNISDQVAAGIETVGEAVLMLQSGL